LGNRFGIRQVFQIVAQTGPVPPNKRVAPLKNGKKLYDDYIQGMLPLGMDPFMCQNGLQFRRGMEIWVIDDIPQERERGALLVGFDTYELSISKLNTL
jgi:hypothetical protein